MEYNLHYKESSQEFTSLPKRSIPPYYCLKIMLRKAKTAVCRRPLNTTLSSFYSNTKLFTLHIISVFKEYKIDCASIIIIFLYYSNLTSKELLGDVSFVNASTCNWKPVLFSPRSVWSQWQLCFCSENNVPVFFLNYQKKDLALLVTVTNMNGDDAYEAKLVGNFPNTLSYSGVRSMTVSMTESAHELRIIWWMSSFHMLSCIKELGCLYINIEQK